MKKNVKYRWGIYFLGIVILTCGLTLNTKAVLGTAPIISIAYAASNILEISLGDASFIEYLFFVTIEIGIHIISKQERRILFQDLLQIPFSIIFTRFLNLFASQIPSFEESGLPIQLGVLAGAIFLTGIGASMMLDMNLIVNPGDGIVKAVSEAAKKEIGITKNIFDCCCLLSTILFCRLCKSPIIGIGLGTICSMLGVGRVMHLFNYFMKQKISQKAGVEINVNQR